MIRIALALAAGAYIGAAWGHAIHRRAHRRQQVTRMGCRRGDRRVLMPTETAQPVDIVRDAPGKPITQPEPELIRHYGELVDVRDTTTNGW
jgi:hypothetical protein